ncbi:MAG TPA: hypothetical protein VLE43_16620, partial [Candidatus Saccharimonadia bacterium]|nr:hypothetical protein [Candidatus Saccharimonadia bacterium]
SGLLFLILMTVLRMLLKIHQNPSWPWSVAFWAGAALMALGILLIALEGLFGGGQAAPKVKER